MYAQRRKYLRICVKAGIPALLAGVSLLSLAVSAQAQSTATTMAKAAPTAPAKAVHLPPVKVSAVELAAPEGSAAAGYKPTTVSNLGPLGPKKILDTPYSVNVVSSDLIDNIQAGSVDNVYQISPVVQQWTDTAAGAGTNIILRGFTQSNSNARAEDGMRVQYLAPESLEDLQDVEITTGLTSFLYGPGDAGGLVNFVEKKPTATPYHSITVGDYGSDAGVIHGDFGGPLDSAGRFAYRLNVVGQDGNTGVNYQNIKRDLVTGVLDWHLSDTATLEFIGKHDYEDIQGGFDGWSFATNSNGSLKGPVPEAPDGSTNYGQRFNDEKFDTNQIGGSLNWKINDIFTARASYLYIYTDIPAFKWSTNTYNALNNTYSELIAHSPGFKYETNTGYAFLDANFDIGSIHNSITTGYFGNILTEQESTSSSQIETISGLTYGSPSYVTQPNWPLASGYWYTGSKSAINNLTIGDDVEFNKFISVLAGGTYTDIQTWNFSNTGTATSKYNSAKTTPSVSLIVKPMPWLETYATYSESLEQGTIVPTTGSPVYTNAGQVLPPFTSSEYEVGAKADVSGLLLTAALFDINKALQLNVANANGTHTYIQNGREIHKGLELTATGNIMEGWRVMGGVTLLDPYISRYQSNPALDGNAPQYVSKQFVKLYSEYDIPFVPGLTATGGIYYFSKAAADITNTYYYPAYAVANLGLRYNLPLHTGQDLTFRLNADNVTNTRYWLSAGYAGQPLTIAGSVSISF